LRARTALRHELACDVTFRLPTSGSPFASILLIVCAFLLTGSVMMIAMHRGHSPRLGYGLDSASAFPGFTVAELVPPDDGLVITSLQSGSEVELSGVAVGDKITSIDNVKVETVAAAENLLRNNPRDPISFHLIHNHRAIDVSISRHKEPLHGA
jgi:membrane-associated protease RseP (regulator of RpoE activity)